MTVMTSDDENPTDGAPFQDWGLPPNQKAYFRNHWYISSWISKNGKFRFYCFVFKTFSLAFHHITENNILDNIVQIRRIR